MPWWRGKGQGQGSKCLSPGRPEASGLCVEQDTCVVQHLTGWTMSEYGVLPLCTWS